MKLQKKVNSIGITPNNENCRDSPTSTEMVSLSLDPAKSCSVCAAMIGGLVPE